ncbi:hypothetical protein MIND_01151700 [Mycena indigotica]|uniref:Uncharacterized protein n=1 Tax=Mycena indigotica TaxID=2126181 RepID=A0A8H6S7P9_9AGAR|nr:uncharacterized protein MIND_01151700 [Mycena indigotica]KAF7293715.1 hypothetical protein MIND_01151700 [Mycena indigotica]
MMTVTTVKESMTHDTHLFLLSSAPLPPVIGGGGPSASGRPALRQPSSLAWPATSQGYPPTCHLASAAQMHKDLAASGKDVATNLQFCVLRATFSRSIGSPSPRLVPAATTLLKRCRPSRKWKAAATEFVACWPAVTRA